MSEPENTPFPHTHECKTPDAKPEWYPLDSQGHYERVCTCRKEIAYPPAWVRPDPLDPKTQRHDPNCELLKIPGIAELPEIYKPMVTLRREPEATYATCKSCGRHWRTVDQPPKPVEAASR